MKIWEALIEQAGQTLTAHERLVGGIYVVRPAKGGLSLYLHPARKPGGQVYALLRIPGEIEEFVGALSEVMNVLPASMQGAHALTLHPAVEERGPIRIGEPDGAPLVAAANQLGAEQGDRRREHVETVD